MKFTRILIVFALITALGLTACSNGKTAPSNKGSEAAAGQGGGGAAAAEPKAATEQMMQTSDQLKELLQGGKTDQAAKKAAELEDQWSTFEDGIKPKYPDLYVKVEKYLSPLVSGAKQNPIDKDAMLKTNADLHSALAELSAALGGGKAAVEDKALAASQELQKATEQYNQYVQEQGKQLVSALEALDKAIKNGDLAQAQQAYLQARLPYERIEPVIETFKDLDAVMDARVDDFKSEQDPEFTGFHRIEHLLFVLKTTKEAEPFAARLLEDGKKMRDSIAAAKIETTDFVTGVGELMEEAQSKKITGEEERWSQATVPVIRANVEGAQEIFSLVRSELRRKDAALEEQIDKSLQKVLQQLEALSPAGAVWAPYDKIEQSKKTDLKNKLETLAEPLSKMPGTLGR
jgi:iron uptake system component EfeO